MCGVKKRGLLHVCTVCVAWYEVPTAELGRVCERALSAEAPRSSSDGNTSKEYPDKVKDANTLVEAIFLNGIKHTRS